LKQRRQGFTFSLIIDLSFGVYAKLLQNTELRKEKFNPERVQKQLKQYLTELFQNMQSDNKIIRKKNEAGVNIR